MKSRSSALCRAFLASALSLGVLSAQAASQTLNVLNWSELIPAEVQKAYAQQTSTEMTYDILDSDDTLESKLLTGHSGYDVVYPSSSYMAKQIKAGPTSRWTGRRFPTVCTWTRCC